MAATRLLDPLLQFRLLRDGRAASLLSRIGVPSQYAIAPSTWAVQPFSRFSLGGLNETSTVVLAMMGLASLRHASLAPHSDHERG